MKNNIKDRNKIIVLCDKFPTNKKLIKPIINNIIPIINIILSGLFENDIKPSNEYLISLYIDHLDVPCTLFSGV